MKKILIVSYYELKESLQCAADAFKQLGYDICNFPLFRYAYDQYDKVPNYLELFLEMIEKEQVDIILWWFFAVSVDDIRYIYDKTRHLYHILYNWDDPFCWNSVEFAKKCCNFNLVITSCHESDDRYYIGCNVGKVQYMLHPYSPAIYSCSTVSTTYECDISFCITNLYENVNIYPGQFINRKQIIDELYKLHNANEITFHLYGSNYLRDMYPQVYKGYVKHDELANVFRKSRINLSTHIVSSKSGYLNERCMLILASRGGILLTEKNDVLTNQCCIFLEQKYISQIKNILLEMKNSSNKYNTIINNGYEFVKGYTWDNWANVIHQIVSKHYFNPTFYREIYQTESNKEWEHFIESGYQNMYDKVKIPDAFNITKYRNDMQNKTEIKDEEVYWHWRRNGMSAEYLNKFMMTTIKKNSNIMNKNDMKLIPQDQIKLFNIFKKISQHTPNETNKFKQLEKIKTIMKTSPNLDLNDYMQQYITFTEYK